MGELVKKYNSRVLLGVMLILSGSYYKKTGWSLQYNQPVFKWVGWFWIACGVFVLVYEFYTFMKTKYGN
ncbi:hypothetical protein Pcar_3491 [Syntrophotalea carbinolica DSM 2380]|uniref:Uncharacterized protein n=1 Tax=Syntrophotalea carbinolica (strain DSM 2380 / NBRC 103641 / GraBd1) TaxID=338963 RepID=J9UJS1_SYNC1|nr:hypothetical protein Pcar_3491 [Syntrophotalea carbinolica DSM 2380]